VDGGYAVEWRTYTASVVDSPGGEPKQFHGTVLVVLKNPLDGSWKAFRVMGDVHNKLPRGARCAVLNGSCSITFAT
jgi:hypothetical protein